MQLKKYLILDSLHRVFIENGPVVISARCGEESIKVGDVFEQIVAIKYRKYPEEMGDAMEIIAVGPIKCSISKIEMFGKEHDVLYPCQTATVTLDVIYGKIEQHWILTNNVLGCS